MNNNKLVLHAVIFKKEFYKTANQALNKAIEMFPSEKIKGFVRETLDSFRVRVRPKTQFISTDYVSKIINPNITIVLGKLKEEPPASSVAGMQPKVHIIDFEKIRSKNVKNTTKANNKKAN